LDEPSLGLAPLVVQTVFGAVREINAQGIPILLVEQNAFRALKVSERGYVMQNGSIVLEDAAERLAVDPMVKKAYLGG
jgi:branched-chain amino acid transport system ATP-binding protein